MTASMRAHRHKWYFPPNAFKYDDYDFTFDTEVCYCNNCDTLRHEGLGGHECYKIPVCDDCNINNTTCTQVGTTTCFICHAPLETYAYVLRFCTEALEEFVCAALAYHARELRNRLRACSADFAEVLESDEVYTIDELSFILHVGLSATKGIEKEIEHYKIMCAQHTSPDCIYPTNTIRNLRALLEEFNHLKAAVFARVADAPADVSSK
jgi:hypothetical protein